MAKGGVDGQENQLSVIQVYEFHKLQKHLNLIVHVYSDHLCLADLAWHKKLPAADQTLP